MGDDMLAYAVEYAVNNWAVFPLRGKLPAIPNPHPRGSAERQTCKGECGLHGHGVLDATTDVDLVVEWWLGRYRGANIGARVPASMFVLDVDDLTALTALEVEHGALPNTLTTISGRAAGGKHMYFRLPNPKISHRRLPKGVEIKTATGYTVQPPSVHPDTGNVYNRIDAAVAAPPAWLVELLLPEQRPSTPPRRHLYAMHNGPSVADEFCVKASWETILEPHGWQCLDAASDDNGCRWRHPGATSQWSATIKNSCLFVYSPNTPFEVTEPGYPRGYTKFRAYAVLDHGGDLSAAAKALRSGATT